MRRVEDYSDLRNRPGFRLNLFANHYIPRYTEGHWEKYMGYDLHILRKTEWSDQGGPPISLQEWNEYVAGDPEMRLDGSAQAELDDGLLMIENEGLAVWTAYSKHDEAGNKAWFIYSDGQIRVKNPDPEIIGKMIAISKVLSAKVQGDDGEDYTIDTVRQLDRDSARFKAKQVRVQGLLLLVAAAVIAIFVRRWIP